MRRHLYKAARSCSQLFSLAVILSTAPSAVCADQTITTFFTQGVASYNAKNYTGAKKSLSAYLQTNPNDYKAHFYLANSLVKLNRLDDASNEYKKVLTLTPDSKTGGCSMEAFNKISDMRSESHTQKPENLAISVSLPAPPQMQFAPPQTQFQPMQISANSQFGNRSPNFYDHTGRTNDLIPASVAGSGAKLSPTVDGRAPNSFSNNGQYGHHHGHHFQNQGFNPYMNGGPPGPMPSMNNPGQFGNPQYFNPQYGHPHHMGRHGRRNQYGYMGGGNNSYAGNAARNHMGGFIKNYEITDTPSGDALPLVADQKKLEDLAPQKITATKPKAASAPKATATKKVLNRN